MTLLFGLVCLVAGLCFFGLLVLVAGVLIDELTGEYPLRDKLRQDEEFKWEE